MAQLDALATAAEGAYRDAAQALSERRHETATVLADAVMAELPALKLERASFIVDINSDTQLGGPDGIDQVAFHVRTNPGTRPGPILKVASGGELSRFLLALKVALADRGSAPTLVFDEIDTGVGGAVADAIGKRLKRLAADVQVLSVTHAPQVAARASTHMLIAKGSGRRRDGYDTRQYDGQSVPAGRDCPHAGWRLGHRRGTGGCRTAAFRESLNGTIPCPAGSACIKTEFFDSQVATHV